MFKPLTKGSLIWLFSLIVTVLPIVAHGEAVLSVSPAVASAGETITSRLEEVEAGETFTVMLLGLNFEATLGTMTIPDGEEALSQEFMIPSDVPSGIYQIQALNEEGESLSAELSVENSLTDITSNNFVEPSDEPMQLDRSKPTGELALIVAVIVISAGLGFWLVIVSQRR